jgi:hypothetical protein
MPNQVAGPVMQWWGLIESYKFKYIQFMGSY